MLSSAQKYHNLWLKNMSDGEDGMAPPVSRSKKVEIKELSFHLDSSLARGIGGCEIMLVTKTGTERAGYPENC